MRLAREVRGLDVGSWLRGIHRAAALAAGRMCGACAQGALSGVVVLLWALVVDAGKFEFRIVFWIRRISGAERNPTLMDSRRPLAQNGWRRYGSEFRT